MWGKWEIVCNDGIFGENKFACKELVVNGGWVARSGGCPTFY